MTATEWVWADQRGKSRDYVKTRDDAIEALYAEEAEHPGVTDGWMLLAFDANGEEVREPEWAEDLLGLPKAPEVAVAFMIQDGERRGLFVQVLGVASSGTAIPIRRGFRRPPSDAIRTLVPSEV
jgi:hypothetical protein